jgi:hypothetical protein
MVEVSEIDKHSSLLRYRIKSFIDCVADKREICLDVVGTRHSQRPKNNIVVDMTWNKYAAEASVRSQNG